MPLSQLGDQLALGRVNACSLPGTLVQPSAPAPGGQEAPAVEVTGVLRLSLDLVVLAVWQEVSFNTFPSLCLRVCGREEKTYRG